MVEITREVNIRFTLPSGVGQRTWKPSPLTGRITQIIRHWPDGCDGLVDMAVGHGDTWMCPNETDTYVALNDATPPIPMDEPIKKNEKIWAIASNADAVNTHSVSCSVFVTGEAVIGEDDAN